MKIQHPILFVGLLLFAALASAQVSPSCSGSIYRSGDGQLSNQAVSKSLSVSDEAASLNFNNWSSKSKAEQLLKQQKSSDPFHAQLMVLIDCNGKASNAKFLQSSNAALAQQLLPLINGSTGNRVAKVKGRAVSGYTIVHIMISNGHLTDNPLFIHQ